MWASSCGFGWVLIKAGKINREKRRKAVDMGMTPCHI
jgi:hypothetical protein